MHTVFTSIAGRWTRSQADAVDSWKRHGLTVVAIQSPLDPIRALECRFQKIDCWLEVEEKEENRKPRIVDMLRLAAGMSDGPFILVNSDIQFGDKFQFPVIKKDEFVAGARNNYRRRFADAVPEEWGLDVFAVHPESVCDIPRNPLRIGEPWWDYWLAYYLQRQGFKPLCGQSGVFFHKRHPLKWSRALNNSNRQVMVSLIGVPEFNEREWRLKLFKAKPKPKPKPTFVTLWNGEYGIDQVRAMGRSVEAAGYNLIDCTDQSLPPSHVDVGITWGSNVSTGLKHLIVIDSGYIDREQFSIGYGRLADGPQVVTNDGVDRYSQSPNNIRTFSTTTPTTLVLGAIPFQGERENPFMDYQEMINWFSSRIEPGNRVVFRPHPTIHSIGRLPNNWELDTLKGIHSIYESLEKHKPSQVLTYVGSAGLKAKLLGYNVTADDSAWWHKHGQLTSAILAAQCCFSAQEIEDGKALTYAIYHAKAKHGVDLLA